MIYVGIALMVIGLVCTNVSGSLTKKYIRRNNSESFMYNAAQMKEEWQRVAREGGVVPSWVSLISMGGWVVVLVGIVLVVREFL